MIKSAVLMSNSSLSQGGIRTSRLLFAQSHQERSGAQVSAFALQSGEEQQRRCKCGCAVGFTFQTVRTRVFVKRR